MIHTEVGRKFCPQLVFWLKKEIRPLYQTGVSDLVADLGASSSSLGHQMLNALKEHKQGQ
jgi:hypothetical protein